jgi:hypothetical protein
MNAVERAQELLAKTGSEIPSLALEYARFLTRQNGGCVEVILTAYAHYAQCMECYHCPDVAYQVDAVGRAWFDEKKAKQQREDREADWDDALNQYKL